MKRLVETEGTAPVLRQARLLLESAAPLRHREPPTGSAREAAPVAMLFAGRRYGWKVLPLAALSLVAVGAAARTGVRLWQEEARVVGSTSAGTAAPLGTPFASARQRIRATVLAAAANRPVAVAEEPLEWAETDARPGLAVATSHEGKPRATSGADSRRAGASARVTTQRPAARAASREGLAVGESGRRSDRPEHGAAPAPESEGPTVAPVSEAVLVQRAVRALRRDGDPERAAMLLERYQSRAPNGVLAEEALALRVEAARASSDVAALRLAREYLARYPQGRYRAQVQRTLRQVGAR